jgi:hypothetical protein
MGRVSVPETKAGECLRRERVWRGKGEATRGSEGLNKSELKPGRLGEAGPMKVSLVEGIASSLLLKLSEEEF